MKRVPPLHCVFEAGEFRFSDDILQSKKTRVDSSEAETEADADAEAEAEAEAEAKVDADEIVFEYRPTLPPFELSGQVFPRDIGGMILRKMLL